MITLNQLFSSPAIQPLGWTLLHSLWQGALIAILVLVTLRILSGKSSVTKYAVSLSGLGLQLMVSISTFIYLYEPAHYPITEAGFNQANHVLVMSPNADANIFSSWTVSLQQYLPMIVLLWLGGAFIFSLRVVASGMYITQLRKQTTPIVDDEIQDLLDCWLLKFGITRRVQLAESICVDTPMVIGYVKPLIVFPAGMVSGLPTEQLELIVLHELTHIRRHDYIINILQLLMEAVFFFNPFVWIISARIREEREHCCDDAVVQHSGKASLYAVTLAQLEESRLHRAPVALALGGSKNQLLTRIKRLMEKRVKPYSGRERVIPAVLMIVGLVCASWLTISTTDNDALRDDGNESETIAQDTTKNKKNKRASYSKSQVITYDHNGTPTEEVTESFEGDEDLFEMITVPYIEDDFDFNFVMAPTAEMPNMPPTPDFTFHFDTIPPMNWSWRSEADMEQFTEEFQKKFQEQFGDFYQKHEGEIQKMMEDIQKELQSNGMDEEWQQEFEAKMKEHEARIQEHMASLHLDERALAHQEAAMKQVEAQLKQMEEIQEKRALEMQKHSQEMEKHAREMEKKAKVMEEKAQQFEKEVKEQLIKDGYLKKDEKVQNLNWSNDGKITINGKEIKDSDRKKYDAIHDKYFNSKGNFIFVE